MDIFSVIAFLGGLAFFLYGMSMLGDGLSRASGGKMEKILEKLTNNRIKAVLLGAGVTAVIQSSSATTVMVVGFVNAGIMKLNQAVGLIMGANIGTTATSWILSLTGIEGSNFFLKMLKPTSFAPILAIIGAFILMFAKSEKKKNVATIMVGFAILMSGMTAMSNAVEPLAEVPEFGQILVKFANPVAGVLAGMIITAVIQSSSASVGILQALCATGNVTYGLAIPIIMGQNIGTCITAIMSAIGANKNAKRAAAIHLYFNLIGTVVCLILFYGINVFVHFDFLTDAIGPANIAIIHSVFNIFTTVLLLPFGNQLVKLAQLTVGNHEEKEVSDEMQIPVLDERFLERPAVAAEYSYVAAKRMAYLSRESLLSSLELFDQYDDKKAERITELEETVDQYEDKIGSYLVQLSSKTLSDTDSRSMTMLLHCIGDFERISDHAVSLMRSAKEMKEKDLHFSEHADAEMSVFRAAVKDIVDTAFSAFVTDNVKEAKKVESLEDVIDDINIQVRNRHVRRLQEGRCTIQLGFILSDMCTDMERISDHCSNISAYQVQQHDSEYDPHAYSNEIRDHEDFRQQREKYRELYELP
ncbi:Na/Pi cotransporter family protein [Jingyaoa shaoxingensis]|uniref:Na/Pi cotransporter family protein n=1 Tax=Jingyaoa shaoxingensis TaxID=2763671 RepID=A0ABR7NAE5_9FIRM|nr:Na/Pi cotransporter family protein [Jingyaoa shaoxingensis]MBC8572772.1 Na/Pi cotransporter family protein [Jingyaoa shaoxingensis]